jgi:hypothetical protein
MARHPKPKELVAKLLRADVLTSQDEHLKDIMADPAGPSQTGCELLQ